MYGAVSCAANQSAASCSFVKVGSFGILQWLRELTTSQMVSDVQAHGILYVGQSFFVCVTLQVAALQGRTVGKVAVAVLLFHRWQGDFAQRLALRTSHRYSYW